LAAALRAGELPDPMLDFVTQDEDGELDAETS
jgi:hypothetical protein